MKTTTRNFFSFIFFTLLCIHANAQVDIFYEKFEGATPGFTLNTTDVSSSSTVENKWIINDVYTGGLFSSTCIPIGQIADTPNQASIVATTGSSTSKYMHIFSKSASEPSIFGGNIFNCNFVVTDNPASDCVIHGNSFAKQTTPVNTVGKTNVTLSFYWICSAGTPVIGEVYYSTNGGTVWTQLTTPITNYSGVSVWTQQTITNPAFDNQTNLQFGFRFVAPATTAVLNDPAFGIDEFRIFTPGTPTNTIATNFAPAPTYCPGAAISVPFTSTGTFTGANAYTVELSDATGNFPGSFPAIGTLTSTANSGTISATIPAGAATGAGYKIRVVSSAPVATGSANTTAFAIGAAPVAGTLQATTPTTVCPNGTVSFSVSGGSGAIAWQSSSDGTNFTTIPGSGVNPTFTSAAISGTTYFRVNSSNTCGNVNSNSIMVTVDSSTPTAGTAQATTATSVCTNGTVSFSVSGGTGSILWQTSTDGTNFTDISGASATTFTSGSLSANTFFRASFVNSCGGAAFSNIIPVTVGGITAITLSSNPPNITSLCGGPITLSIPSGFTSIVWSSGPTGVSSIVATSPGEYSVRAQSSGGCQAQSDTITIVQSENPTAGLSYSQATPGVYEVVFTNTSENSASYLWDFGNNFTTTAANPTFTFNADGEYNIRLIATNACGSDTLDTVIVVIKVGINDLESAINLAIYPNPFKDQIRIETESAKAEKLELSIYNMVGKLISKESYTSAGKTIRTADLSGVANGIYFIKIQSETGSVSRKVVKN